MTTMWKTLHQLAAPPRLYQICGRLVPWLAAAGIIVLATGWVRGFGFAPADYQQGQSLCRLMFLKWNLAIKPFATLSFWRNRMASFICCMYCLGPRA